MNIVTNPSDHNQVKAGAHHLAGLCEISSARVHEWLQAFEYEHALYEAERVSAYAKQLVDLAGILGGCAVAREIREREALKR